jgi:hypothetical protein
MKFYIEKLYWPMSKLLNDLVSYRLDQLTYLLNTIHDSGVGESKIIKVLKTFSLGFGFSRGGGI